MTQVEKIKLAKKHLGNGLSGKLLENTLNLLDEFGEIQKQLLNLYDVSESISIDLLDKHNLKIIEGCYGMYKLYQNDDFLLESEEKYCYKEAQKIINLPKEYDKTKEIKTYIIQEIIGFGYWSNRYEDFKGFLYASHYNTKKEAIFIAKALDKPVTIITIYT